MEKVKNQLLPAKRITPDNGHYFYGYYDNPAFDGEARYHLCHRVPFYDRYPTADDTAELGMIELATGRYIPLAETTCWNFQQGTMLQWHPAAPNDEVIFNAREDGACRGVVLNVHTKARRLLEQPVVNVDPTGRWALSVNFDRMFDFRPGYGYAGKRDRFYDEPQPAADGVYLTELATGESRLVLSLAEIGALTGADPGAKLLVNHINFNTDGSRFLLLARNFPTAGGHWKTAMLTANSDGSDPFLLSGYASASHYHWRDREQLVIWASSQVASSPGEQLLVLQDQTQQKEALDPAFFLRDGHCSYSPDRKWLLYDSYPDADHYRHLYVYDLVRRQGHTLASYYSDPAISGDLRCDLHPRWTRFGTAISFDSIHEGQRAIYSMDVREIIG
ncbi:hypothetical protein [Paenibacillus daejeonensis]|uniref:hypothetical protein n=1 Tax=Paenibacillus daejeonensis TaxID=135193 RepID=UPI00037AEE2C|nr:hypothetical protein [Paenibacillus daejeonensis]